MIRTAMILAALATPAGAITLIPSEDGRHAFRAGGSQCFDGKAGGAIIPCDVVDLAPTRPQARPCAPFYGSCPGIVQRISTAPTPRDTRPLARVTPQGGRAIVPGRTTFGDRLTPTRTSTTIDTPIWKVPDLIVPVRRPDREEVEPDPTPSPVPLPAAGILLALALGCMAALKRMKR